MREQIPGYTVDTLDLTESWDLGGSPYAREIAARVLAVMKPWVAERVTATGARFYPNGIDLNEIDQAVSEALCQLAADIRRGKQVEIEYLGVFQARDGVLTTKTNRDVTFEPEPLLIEPWPVPMERVA